jgi:hypothetical protein
MLSKLGTGKPTPPTLCKRLNYEGGNGVGVQTLLGTEKLEIILEIEKLEVEKKNEIELKLEIEKTLRLNLR